MLAVVKTTPGVGIEIKDMPERDDRSRCHRARHAACAKYGAPEKSRGQGERIIRDRRL